MEKHSSELYVDFLAKENEKLKAQAPAKSPESVFDMGGGGVLKKAIWDMKPEEFKAYEAQLKQEALSRK